jgi:hypothetical protein
MSERFSLCPECGALPCDWTDNPARGGSAYHVISLAVASYGKPGGPWNVPSDPGGWIALAKDWLEEAQARGEA